MKDNTNEKSLMSVNENSLAYKIKSFFKNLFHKKETINNANNFDISEHTTEKVEQKNAFMKSIRNIEDEETKLLKLQKQYRSGKIKAEELTEEQINALSELYDKQIAKLKETNSIMKQKILEYRKNTNI